MVGAICCHHAHFLPRYGNHRLQPLRQGTLRAVVYPIYSESHRDSRSSDESSGIPLDQYTYSQPTDRPIPHNYYWDEELGRYRHRYGSKAGKFASAEEVFNQPQTTVVSDPATLQALTALNHALNQRLDRLEKQLGKVAKTGTRIHRHTRSLHRKSAEKKDLILMGGYAAWFGVLLVMKLLLQTGIPQAANSISQGIAGTLNPNFRPENGPVDTSVPQKGDTIGTYEITSGFGGRESPGGIGSTDHKGVDVGTEMGTELRVPVDADVACDVVGGYGTLAIITPKAETGVKFTFQAGHLSECVPGFYLVGQVFGKSGNSGNSTGPHLHWEQLQDGTQIPPYRGYLARVLGVVTATPMSNITSPSGDISANPEAINVLFNGLTSPGVAAIGTAEGTLNADGSTTLLYYGHTDPGNYALNRGFGSWQASPVANAEEGDKLALDRIKNQCIPDATADAKANSITLTPELLVQVCDAWIQAPLAANDLISNLKKCQDQGKSGNEALLCARVNSYYDPATGRLDTTFETLDDLIHDQRRRMEQIQDTLSRYQLPSLMPAAQSQPRVQLASTTAQIDSSSIARLQIGRQSCTGFMVAPSTLLTANHCFRKSDGIAQIQIGGRQTTGRQQQTIAGDVAVVTVDGSFPYFQPATAQVGQSATIPGYPLGNWKVVSGSITSVTSKGNWKVQTSEIVEGGTSGAPLLVSGKWSGVVVGGEEPEATVIPRSKIGI
ncbi:trypsin-like peptidase domain-containing protein [Pantanalinema sp. GBBB05]|uniref:trypsin-like peptidase domain-containing protein n=1 Tax=Pantanalinema sp. GBBB05 TaxID=2604139 RepID=UPI001E12D0BC|nr:peptidoglycan DD-metalloendopeptidase family protein [Pantanalinema sp. GBBB05]